MKNTKVLSNDVFPLIKETLNNKQAVSIKVTGNSMRPFLVHQKSIVTLLQSNTYKKYDIVLYENPQHKMVLHRIVKVHDNLIICGDALKNNEIIHKDNVYGKVIDINTNQKPIKMDTNFYKLKVRLWVTLKPFRRILLKLTRK